MNNEFGGNRFALQVIAKGSYVDAPTGYDRAYIVETTAIRLNHIALNEWLSSQTSNSRGCYETDEEWEAHKTKYDEMHKAVKARIIGELGIDAEKGSVCITQSLSEVFAVVHIWEIVGTENGGVNND